ncbi:MAG: ATP-binding protein [Actinobacteria bacterium]|nr:ATP-binding protein [Actinomycetota bacterium]
MSAPDSSETPPDVHFEFDHRRSAPREAREAIKPLFAPDDPLEEDVTLATSELVSNVITHTDDGGTLDAWDPKPDVPLRVEVADTDSSPAAPVEVPPERGGMGLKIVDQLADDWGVVPREDGKVVWAEFDRHKRDRS